MTININIFTAIANNMQMRVAPDWVQGIKSIGYGPFRYLIDFGVSSHTDLFKGARPIGACLACVDIFESLLHKMEEILRAARILPNNYGRLASPWKGKDCDVTLVQRGKVSGLTNLAELVSNIAKMVLCADKDFKLSRKLSDHQRIVIEIVQDIGDIISAFSLFQKAGQVRIKLKSQAKSIEVNSLTPSYQRVSPFTIGGLSFNIGMQVMFAVACLVCSSCNLVIRFASQIERIIPFLPSRARMLRGWGYKCLIGMTAIQVVAKVYIVSYNICLRDVKAS